MRNIIELHSMHNEIVSEVNFIKTELKFLLKLINNEYSQAINNEKIKILDSYYVSFEKNIAELEQLNKSITEEEKGLKTLYKNDLIDLEETGFKDWEKGDHKIRQIQKAVKALKESFYDYMLNKKF